MGKKQKKKLGMYDETPRIKIGKYFISDNGPGKIWIEDESGEGGEFREDLFAGYVHAFYNTFF